MRQLEMENNKKNLRNYITPSGKNPFSEWLAKLDPSTRIRVRRHLDRVELGNFGNHEPVGEGVSELKLFFGPGYRIYYTEYGDTIIILLCAGHKGTQVKDIKLAKSYWRELKERSDEQS